MLGVEVDAVDDAVAFGSGIDDKAKTDAAPRRIRKMRTTMMMTIVIKKATAIRDAA